MTSVLTPLTLRDWKLVSQHDIDNNRGEIQYQINIKTTLEHIFYSYNYIILSIICMSNRFEGKCRVNHIFVRFKARHEETLKLSPPQKISVPWIDTTCGEIICPAQTMMPSYLCIYIKIQNWPWSMSWSIANCHVMMMIMMKLMIPSMSHW